MSECNYCGTDIEVEHDCVDVLRSRIENAEAIINGMFPMWIAAMAYCEHGRAADLNRMRNYYNGRDNPLTTKQLVALFEIQKEVKYE